MVRQYIKAKGLFVTGTDTGVGKTLVAGAIARQLSRQGKRVGVFKPIATGCRAEREGLVSDDAEFLAHCSDSRFSLEQINPVRYRKPLAPYVAAELEHREIDWQELTLAYRNVAAASEIVIVEGIGGVNVPLERDYWVADLMADMGLPGLIVAHSRLGTINHTLLTVEVCRGRGIKIAGIVINSHSGEKSDLAEETNPRVIAEVSGERVLTVIPYDKGSYVEKGLVGEEVMAAIDLVEWGDWAG